MKGNLGPYDWIALSEDHMSESKSGVQFRVGVRRFGGPCFG